MDGTNPSWFHDYRYGRPVVKDGCGVYGVIRKSGASRLPNTLAVDGISCIKYRGSNMGAGYASVSLAEDGPGSVPYRLQAFVKEERVASLIKQELAKSIGPVRDEALVTPNPNSQFAVWRASLKPSEGVEARLEYAVDRLNEALLSPREVQGRIFSYGRFLNVYKDVGYPMDVAKMWGLDSRKEEADLWIAHTRQPTNSPGAFPIWSHPFTSMDTAIVHNGDISSFGANMELLTSWGLESHVGTDSEVIARILDHLVRLEGLSVAEAATVLTNPYERHLSPQTLQVLARYRGARLDGPFAVVAGYADGDDVYLVALTDRSKFRPLLIGEDADCYYVASEENQIRNHSPDAKVWTPAPSSFFIASLKKGVIATGTQRPIEVQSSTAGSLAQPKGRAALLKATFDAEGKEFKDINEFIRRSRKEGVEEVTLKNVSGQRYTGIGLSPLKDGAKGPFKVNVVGYPGNCFANLNDGADFEVFGNVGDDMADTMHAGSVVVHGNVRDVAGQALQGGRIFVRGTAGNRLAIQMREYRHSRPRIVVGESCDDYLGEYMAGGLVAVLDLAETGKPALNFVGTGMVGGAIYIRGRVGDEQLGLLPERQDILNYLSVAQADGEISEDVFKQVSAMPYPSESQVAKLVPERTAQRLKLLFYASKYTKTLAVERRKLNADDLTALGEDLRDFFGVFELPRARLEEVLASEFTIIRTREEKVESAIPPQEVPVEE